MLPTLTIFFENFVKDIFYQQPLPQNIYNLNDQIIAVMQTIDEKTVEIKLVEVDMQKYEEKHIECFSFNLMIMIIS